ncbi:MAG: hypothetical protein ACRDDZ_01270 [Marinifilaceae bacterium]
MATNQPIAIGVSKLEMGDPGTNGIAGTTLSKLPMPSKDTIVFNFNDPKKVSIPLEGGQNKYVGFVKADEDDYIEFAIPTPTNEEVTLLSGGTHTKGTEQAPKDIWNAPTAIAEIVKTFKITTKPVNGMQVIYTFNRGKIMSRFSQAPTDEKPDLLLVRVYRESCFDASGNAVSDFSREVVAVS